jgi:prephenate dehydratase
VQSVILCSLESLGALAHEAVGKLRTVAPTELLPMPTVAQVLETVEHTPGSAGLLPIEDAYEGEMTSVYDRLVFENHHALICDEVVVSDSFDAFVPAGATPESARTAVSTPRGIEMCFRFVQEQGLTVRYADTPGEACRSVAEGEEGLVALAPSRTATSFGLVRVAAGVEDLLDLKTRFIVVARHVPEPSGNDKTTLVVTPAFDRSGTLADLLDAFSENDVNMVSLASRPLRSTVGTHCFQITCEGHLLDASVQSTVRRLWSKGARVKFLGSYPAWDSELVLTPFDALPTASVGPDDADADRAALLAPPVG